jgi:ABC-type bacteriocin/lantibiotic exporter with double-glycine peptidase domain
MLKSGLGLSPAEPMVAMEPLEMTSRIGVFAVTGVLFALMAVAYLRVPSPRMLWVAVSFALFFAGGIILVSEVLNNEFNAAVSEGLNYTISLVALVVLAASLLKGS